MMEKELAESIERQKYFKVVTTPSSEQDDGTREMAVVLVCV